MFCLVFSVFVGCFLVVIVQINVYLSFFSGLFVVFYSCFKWLFGFCPSGLDCCYVAMLVKISSGFAGALVLGSAS